MAAKAYVVYVMGKGSGGLRTKLFLHYDEEGSSGIEDAYRLDDEIQGASVWKTEKDANAVADGLNTPTPRGFKILGLELDSDDSDEGGGD